MLNRYWSSERRFFWTGQTEKNLLYSKYETGLKMVLATRLSTYSWWSVMSVLINDKPLSLCHTFTA